MDSANENFQDDDLIITNERIISNSLPKPNLTGEMKVEARQDCTDEMTEDSKRLIDESQCFASCYELTMSGVPELVTVAITSSKILKIRSNCVIQTQDIAKTSVKALKVLIHHEFLPVLNRYICILKSDYNLEIREFGNFKMLSSPIPIVSDIKSISNGLDSPVLNIFLRTGAVITGSPSLFGQTKGTSESQKSKAKKEMCASLNQVMQSSLHTISNCKMNLEMRREENEKSTKMARDHLKGVSNSTQTSRSDDTSCCHISAVKFRIIPTNKLVISVTVQNKHRSCSIHSLSLCLTSPSTSLQFSCSTFKSVSRRRASSGPPTPSKGVITVERLTTNILRPGKNAFIVATCSLPMFLSSNITIQSLLSYRVDPSAANGEHPSGNGEHPGAHGEAPGTLQIPVPDITIDCLQINKHLIDLDATPPVSGISLNSLAVLASTEQYSLLITSHTEEITKEELVQRVGRHTALKKLDDLTDVYVFKDCGLVQYCALHLVTLTGKIEVHMHANSLQQAMLIVHILRSSLPHNVHLEASGNNASHLGNFGSEESYDVLQRNGLLELRIGLNGIIDFLQREERLKRRKTDDTTSKKGRENAGTSREGRVDVLKDIYSEHRSQLGSFTNSEIVVVREEFSEHVNAFRKKLREVEENIMRHAGM